MWIDGEKHDGNNITAGIIAQCLEVDVNKITNLTQIGADADTWGEQEYMGFSFILKEGTVTHAAGYHTYYIEGTRLAPAPTDLVATAGDGRVSIAFAAPSNDGGLP